MGLVSKVLEYQNFFPLAVVLLVVLAIVLFCLIRKIIAPVNALLLSVSILLGLYLCELYLNYVHSQNISANYHKFVPNSVVDYDKRSRIDVIRDLRKKGVDAFPALQLGFIQLLLGNTDFPPELKRYLPVGPIANKTTVFCNEMGQYAVYKSDRFGFRNPEIIYKNDIDVMLIGDSFVQGACVDNKTDLGNSFRSVGVNAMNLGISGNGPRMNLMTAIKFAPYFKPKTVFWFHFHYNDFDALYTPADDGRPKIYKHRHYDNNFFKNLDSITKIKNNYLIENFERKLASQPNQHSYSKPKIIYDRNFFTLRKLRLALGLTNTRRYIKIEQLALEELTSIFTETETLIQGWGGKLFIVLLPSQRAFFPKPPFDTYSVIQQPYRTIDGLAKTLDHKFNILNFKKHIEQFPDPFVFFPSRRHGHYSPEGYKLLGDFVVDAILSQKNED